MATPTNLFEYFQQKGQALPSVPERRTMFGLGQEYAGTPEQNVALLNKLLSPTPQPIVTVGPTPVSVPTPAPVAPTAPPPPPVTPVSPTPPATDLTGAVETPELPTLPTIADTKAYTEGMLKTLETQKQQVLDAYNTQREKFTKEIEVSGKAVENLETKQFTSLESTDPTKYQYYAQQQEIIKNQLKAAQTASGNLEKDYLANQTLVNELGTLLTNLQAEVTAAEAQTSLASIARPRIAKLKEEVNSRVGVIEAVMNARTGQINMAYTIIDQAVDDVERDRKDQLAYYKTVYDFYGEKKDTEGAKLIQLTKDEKDFVEKEIKFLESEVKVSQDTVDYIKDLMVDPKTADIIAQAGVTLKDSVPEIQQKLSNWTYRQEIVDLHNKMEKDGFKYLPLGAGTKPAEEITTMRDSRGKTYTYWKEKKKTTEEIKADEPLSILDVGRYQELYPDAGVIAGDTEKTANEKVAKLSQPKNFTEEELRVALEDDKNNKMSYEDAVVAINANDLIFNKDVAKKVAAEVYDKEISIPKETEEMRIQQAGKAKEQAEKQGLPGYINEKGEFISLNPEEKTTNLVYDFLFK